MERLLIIGGLFFLAGLCEIGGGYAHLLDQGIFHFLSPSGGPTQGGTTPSIAFRAVWLSALEFTAA